jgi:flavin reductase (DIM6/NTAB) family NADH-FMN oxidoreductase RutF
MSLSRVDPDHEVMTVTPAAFRSALGRFATGVTVITVDHEGQVHGMTANAFTSVSLDPPRVLVCVNRRSRSHEYLQAKQRFGANILTENQRPISEFYALPCATRCLDSGTNVRFFRTRHGTPVLDGSLAFLECRLHEIHGAGDHSLFVAEVEGIVPGAGEPLLYFRGNYRSIGRIQEEAMGERQ